MKPSIPTTPELDAAYVKFCEQYKQCIDCPLYRFSHRGSCLTAFKEAQAEARAEAQTSTPSTI